MAAPTLAITGIVIAVALIYALFDVFNKRNVPSVFAYATLALGFILTVAYNSTIGMAESLMIAAVVLALGYVMYRIGQIGAADVIEFAAISLMLPVQPQPYFGGGVQLGIPLPFILSVFIATGVVALLMIPFYYLPRAKRMVKGSLLSLVAPKDALKGLLVLVAYLAFTAFIVYYTPVGAAGIAVLLLVTLSSFATAVFEKPMTMSMVEYLPVREFEEGDIIALNLLSEKEIGATRSKVGSFGRLVTTALIRRMKAKRIPTRFPVYRAAMPLALPIFVGTVASVLLGNLILFII